MRSLIGDDGKRLIFLHNDSWICSAKASAAETKTYDRPFFIPADWLTTDMKMMTGVTCKGDIIFVKRDEVAVITRGLGNIEQEGSNMQPPGNRQLLLKGKMSSRRT